MSVLLFPACKYFLSNLPASSLLPFQSILHTTKESSCLQGPGKKAPPKCKSKRERVLVVGSQVTRAMAFGRERPQLAHGLEGNRETDRTSYPLPFSLLPMTFIGQTQTENQEAQWKQSTKVGLPRYRAEWKRGRVDLERQTEIILAHPSET